MKKQKKYKDPKFKYMVVIKWSEEDQCYVADMPELMSCATDGSTIEEAAKNATDAIESWLDGCKSSGFPIPEPLAAKKFSGKFIARIDPELHRHLTMKAKELGKTLNGFVMEVLRKAIF